MKRVLIFSVAYRPFEGGAEIAVKNITDRISPEEIEFDMITVNLDGNQPASEKIGNVTVYRVGAGTPGKFLLPFSALRKARALQRLKKYDAVWAIMASQAGIAAARFKSHNSSIKMVLTLQEGDEEQYLKRYVFGNDFFYRLLIRPWHLLPFQKADRVTVISNHLKNRASTQGVTVPIDVVPNGADIELFSTAISDSESEKLKERVGKKPEDVFLVTTSRLVAKNAVADAIRSLLYLPLNVKLLVIGDGPEKALLTKQVAESDLGDRVIFLGSVPHEDIKKYLNISNIFVRPSLSEGFGNSFIEAMAAGLPVIATPVGGITDFIFDPEKNPGVPPTGLFCEVRNPESIAATVTLLLENAPLRERLVGNAKTLVALQYDWAGIARRMKDILIS